MLQTLMDTQKTLRPKRLPGQLPETGQLQLHEGSGGFLLGIISSQASRGPVSSVRVWLGLGTQQGMEQVIQFPAFPELVIPQLSIL